MQPHAHIPPYYETAGEKRRFLEQLFDRNAPYYERTSQLLSLGSGRFYRRYVLTRMGMKGGTMLDVASGTGLLARAAVDVLGRDATIVAIEPSTQMIAEGRKLATLPFIRGIADALPVASERFDLVTMGYALRHVSDIELVFREFYRVLRPGGRLVVLEISRPASRPGMRLAELYFKRVLPRVTRFATRSGDAADMMRYYWDTIASCVAPDTILGALRNVGFQHSRRQVYLGIFSEYHATRS